MDSKMSQAPRRKGKKKPKLDSSDESDSGGDEGFHQTKEAGSGGVIDEESHRTLIQSLKSSFKTKRKRFQEDEDEEILDGEGKLILTSSGVGSMKESFLDLLDERNHEVMKEVKETMRKPKKKKVKSGEEKSLSLTTSLEKPVVERIQREILYNNTNKEVSKWNSVVYKNRMADQLIFPLGGDEKLKKKDEKRSGGRDDFVPMTRLEEEIAKVVHGPGYVERRRAEVYGTNTAVDGDGGESFVRTVGEALERHHELARLRAIQSYEMAKAKRQGKIKSKKYHRLQRREKIRKELKDFEELQKTDPEAALVKLEELDRARVQERMSLKHRNTSKWAKAQVVRAKYNRESRAELSEQLKISKELTRKVAESSDESDPDDIDLDIPGLVKSSFENPWCMTGSVKDNDKVNLYYTGYRKFWEDVNQRKERERKRAQREEEIEEARANEEEVKVKGNDPQHPPPPPRPLLVKKVKKQKGKKVSVPQTSCLVSPKDVPQQEMSVDDLDELLHLANQRLKEKMRKEVKGLKGNKERKKKEKRDGDGDESDVGRMGNRKNQEGDGDEIQELNVDDGEINREGGIGIPGEEGDSIPLRNIPISSLREDPKKRKLTEQVIDPAHFLEIRKSTKFDMKETNLDFGDDGFLREDGEEEEEREHLKIIAEAFEDDDLLGEFERRKAEEVESGQPKEINLTLPGWGEWGGKDWKSQPSRKKRKFIKKAPTARPRKDASLPHVILNESGDVKVREHQVKELPFPFTRVADYEKMVRAPVGRTWLPELAMKDLIAPKIITRLGRVIQPISEEVLVKSSRKFKSKTLKLIK